MCCVFHHISKYLHLFGHFQHKSKAWLKSIKKWLYELLQLNGCSIDCMQSICPSQLPVTGCFVYPCLNHCLNELLPDISLSLPQSLPGCSSHPQTSNYLFNSCCPELANVKILGTFFLDRKWVFTSGGTLRQDNCQLIGQSLIALARQAHKYRN